MRFLWVSRIYKFKNVFLLKNLQKIYEHVSTWPSFLPGPGKGPIMGVGLRITLSQGQLAGSSAVCAVFLQFVRPLLTSVSSPRKKLCNQREYVMVFVHYFILVSHSRHSFVF